MELSRAFIIALTFLQGYNANAQVTTQKPDLKTESGVYYSLPMQPVTISLTKPVLVKDSVKQKIKSSETEQINSPTYSLTAIAARTDISVYPNPFSKSINIQYNENVGLEIKVTDLSGNILASRLLAPGERQIDLSGLATSVYLLKIYDLSHQLIQTFKLDKVK